MPSACVCHRYARKAKSVDVAKLKTDLWSLLNDASTESAPCEAAGFASEVPGSPVIGPTDDPMGG